MTLTLKDGRAFEIGWGGAGTGTALVFDLIGDHTLLELAEIFSRPADTEQITIDTGLTHNVYDGYTRLKSIDIGGWQPGAALITLIKED